MDYEEKYKSALKWMQSLYGGLHGVTKEEAEKYFPELKESEGERIRKKLISFVENWKNFRPNSPFDDYAVYTSDRDECDRILAWLEKQGKQNFDYEHADIPQKDFAPIEQKTLNAEKQDHMLDSNKVIEWIECEEFQGWAEPIDIRPIIRKFKKDFGL